jgi:hypothetical protein
MRDEAAPTTSDWLPWKPIPSTVTDEQLNSLEYLLGLRYPPLYRHFLKYKHIYGIGAGGIRFEPHLIDQWRPRLERFYRV